MRTRASRKVVSPAPSWRLRRWRRGIARATRLGVQSTPEVFAALREIAVLLEFAGAPKFKVKAYQRGADVVKTVGDVGPLVEQGRLGELEGIGATLSSQIQELWNTGSSQYLLRLRSEQPPGTSELAQVEETVS